MLKRLTDWLALTGTERKVLWFLATALVVGAALRLYRTSFPDAPAFEYHSQDSTFAALSGHARDSVDVPKTAGDEPVRLNAATREQLMTLRGVGPVLADRILEYRAVYGPFRSVDQLASVKGMSKKKVQQLRPYVTVDH